MTTMIDLKCKNCGAPLPLDTAVDNVVKCRYCTSTFTLPKNESEPAAVDAIRMGNMELDNCAFDRAATAFKKAIELDGDEPEGFIGLALATHRVQYLKDSVNNCLQPICHEISKDDFTKDTNYRLALSTATDTQRNEYKRKGEEIDKIRKEFYALKQSGLDYDCFICVKVTGDDGKPTSDSHEALKIYHHLKDQGYKPFYSEEEIRGRAGAEYEALILYALRTSECMLIVCGNEEYLQTKWVKNEYTRFQSLINDEDKERDSITIVFSGRPIERLPGRDGKIQGIDLSKPDAYTRISKYVEGHTPQARQRKAEEANRKATEEAERNRQFTEQARKLAEMEEVFKSMRSQDMTNKKSAEDEKNGLTNEQAKRIAELEAELRALKNSGVASAKSSASEISDEFNIFNNELIKYTGKSNTVVIPNGITKIRDKAFSGCEHIASVTIPNSVTSIGKNVFDDCDNLTIIHYAGDIASWCEISNGDEICSQIIYIGNEKLTDMTSITIPNGVKSICSYAFKGCYNLKSITIPNSVTSIGDGSFYDCSSLTSITIPDSITSIGDDAFRNCNSLMSIAIPDSVISMGDGSFENCSSLTSITIPSSVTSIGSQAFDNCPIESATIPAIATSYIKNSKLKTVVITSGTSIGDQAFFGCSSLTSITIPNSVTSIGWRAFQYRSSITNIYYTGDIASWCKIRGLYYLMSYGALGKKLYINNTEITGNLVIPNGVTSIENWAFYGCSSLTNVTIPKDLSPI